MITRLDVKSSRVITHATSYMLVKKYMTIFINVYSLIYQL